MYDSFYINFLFYHLKFLHCHVEFHSEAGMAMVFKVGNENDMPTAPSNWPECGDFKNNAFSTVTTTVKPSYSTAPSQNEVHLNRTYLELIFGQLNDLVSIDLSNSNINTMDSATFSGLNKIEVLNLQKNKLTKIDGTVFKELISLKKLILESNNIVQFDKNALVGLLNLELVCLAENPISTFFESSIKDICRTNPKCVVINKLQFLIQNYFLIKKN